MKNEGVSQLSRGLRLIFAGELLGVVATIPGLGLVALPGLVVGLMGLVTAGGAEEGYKRALYFTIGSLALNILSNLAAKGSGLGTLLSLGISLLNFLTVYVVCTVTCSKLEGWDDRLAEKGRGVWKLFGGALVVAAVCTLAAEFSAFSVAGAFFAVVAGVGTVLAMIVMMAVMVLYMYFLYRASNDLKNA